MPYFGQPPRAFRAIRDVDIDYRDFSGGLNTIFRPTELKDNELAQADNLILTGKGVPTGRPGSKDCFLAGSGYVRDLNAYLDPSDGTNILYAVTDAGYLVQKSGASYSIINGVSFPSGSVVDSAQLGGFSYIVTNNTPMVRFDGTNIDTYATVPVPSGVGVSNISGATGTTTYSWRITALNLLNETTGSTPISFASLPFDLSETSINVNWSKITAASGGYNVYRGTPGNETFVATVDPDTTNYIDTGQPSSDLKFPPNTNNTAGVKGKYILKFGERLIIAGVNGDPNIVYVSGPYPYQDRFHWADGGGYVRIEPDSGDEITGLGIAGSQTQGGSVPASVLIFMKRSVHQMIIKTVGYGNYSLLDLQTQRLAPTGCSSHKTVVNVDNNTFYVGREGMYTIGQEQAYLQQLRTRELSAKIRPYFMSLSENDLNNACSGYIDYRYLISFPTRKETMTYDFQRKGAFMGPWTTPWGISSWLKYYDATGAEKWLAGNTEGVVKEFNTGLTSDSGTAIRKILRTRKEDFKNWSVMKVLKTLYVLFRSVKGSVQVNIRLEERSGNTVNSKSFNISGSFGTAGWGTDLWGTAKWGTSGGTVSLTGEEIIRWAQLYKTARVVQVEVLSTGATDNWEFLGIRAQAQPLQEGSLNSATRV